MAITEGLPAAGSNIGGAMKGIAPGAGAIILIPKMAASIGEIPGAIAKRISGKKSKKAKKKKSKSTRKSKRKSLIKRYNTPLIPKMGPY